MPYNPNYALTNSQMKNQRTRQAVQDFMDYFQTQKATNDDEERKAALAGIQGAQTRLTGAQRMAAGSTAADNQIKGIQSQFRPQSDFGDGPLDTSKLNVSLLNPNVNPSQITATAGADAQDAQSQDQSVAQMKADYLNKYFPQQGGLHSAQDFLTKDAASREAAAQAPMQTKLLQQEIDLNPLKQQNAALQPTLLRSEIGKNNAEAKKASEWTPDKSDKVQIGYDKNNQGVIVDLTKGTSRPLSDITRPDVGAGGSRLVTSIASNFQHARDEYEKRAQPYLALQGIVNSSSYGTKIGDVSMLDKMAIMETGHIPTESQYAELKSQPGLVGKIAMMREGLQNGAKLTEADRQSMLKEAAAQMKIVHDSYKESIDEASKRSLANSIDPSKTITPGGYFQKVGKYLDGGESGPLKVSAGKSKADELGAKYGF